MKRIEMQGQRFGRLLIGACLGSDDKHTYWEALCDCGNTVKVKRNELMKGKVQSCGCYRKEATATNKTIHGHHNTRAYKSWKHLIQRCTNPKCKDYPNYGGRGIQVCEEWRDFRSFMRDMGECPDGLQIDRIDNDKGYEPGNCRWVTCELNNRNRRDNRILTVDGVSKTIAEWAAEKGIRPNVIATRLSRGWDEHRAVEG